MSEHFDRSPSVRPQPESPAQVTAPPAPLSAHFCPQCGSPVSEGGPFCASCGTDLRLSGPPAPGSRVPTPEALSSTATSGPDMTGSGPDGPLTPPTIGSETELAVVASAARRPARRGRAAAIAFWVVGILLLVVGGLGFGLTAIEDDANAKTLATDLTELRGDLTGSEARAAALRSRTAALAAAMEGYAASLEALRSAHEALVDGVNRSWAEFTESGSVAIARHELPPLIDRYEKAVAEQEICQSALAVAVAEQQAVTP